MIGYPVLSVFEEISAYEALWDRPKTSFRALAAQLSDFPQRLASSFIEPQLIEEVANLFRRSIFQTTGFSVRAQNALLVPIPPHKSKSDPGYDDRNLQMLNYFMPKGNVHELILQSNSRVPLHKSNDRDVAKLKQNYALHFPNQDCKFKEIWLFDDILRHGTHFRAIHLLIKEFLPDAHVVGFYIARSVQIQDLSITAMGVS